jgi:hypothetical protein
MPVSIAIRRGAIAVPVEALRMFGQRGPLVSLDILFTRQKRSIASNGKRSSVSLEDCSGRRSGHWRKSA